MQYELFDTSSGNILGAYPTEREALDILRTAIEEYGESYAADLALGVRDDRGYPRRLAEGRKLVTLATRQQFR